MPRIPAALVGTAVTTVLLSGCAAFSEGGPGAGSEDGLTIVTGMYPLTWISEQVAGERAEVVDLTPPGSDPHDLEMSAAQTAAVSDADLVVLERGMQAPLDTAADQNAGGTVLDVVEAAELVPHDELGAEEHGGSHDGHDHGSHEGDGSHEGHDHGDLGDVDPHFWQDPERMAAVTEAVADELAALNPDHAETYRSNAEQTVAKLNELHRAYRDGLADCRIDTVVVGHDAFGYLGKYGLDFAPIAGLTPDAEPTPAALARLHDLIEAEGITTVFYERLASPAMAESLAEDVGVSTDVLDPLEGLTDETADEDYLSLMRTNLSSLQTANECR